MLCGDETLVRNHRVFERAEAQPPLVSPRGDALHCATASRVARANHRVRCFAVLRSVSELVGVECSALKHPGQVDWEAPWHPRQLTRAPGNLPEIASVDRVTAPLYTGQGATAAAYES